MGALTNPGSPEAIKAGCCCPVFDNGKGRGYMGVPGTFVINGDCPLHGRSGSPEPPAQSKLESEANDEQKASGQ